MANDSFLQSAAWERFQTAAGVRVVRDQRLLYLRRDFFFGHYHQSSRCAIADEFSLPELGSDCFLRFEPIDQVSLLHLKAAAGRKKVVESVALQPRQSLLLDISQPEEALLAGFKPKHRYNLRLAQKAGLATDVYSDNLTEQFERFWQLLTQTADRQDFRTHPANYYKSMFAELEKEQLIRLIFVRKDTLDLGVLVLITYGDTATYLHGGSSLEHKELMAPYLLHWQAMQTAKAAGCTTYDFWGTDAEYDQEKKQWQAKTGHPSSGTTRFKLGFGGEIVEYPGCFDIILKPFCYTLYKRLRATRGGKRAFS